VIVRNAKKTFQKIRMAQTWHKSGTVIFSIGPTFLLSVNCCMGRVYGESAGDRTQDQRLKRMFLMVLQGVATICIARYKSIVCSAIVAEHKEKPLQGIARDTKKKYHKSITLECMLGP
jgi:hypothetical protein